MSLRRVPRLPRLRSDETLLGAACAGQRSVSVLTARYRTELVSYATWLLDDGVAVERLVGKALSHEQIIASAHIGVAPTTRAILYRCVHRAVADQLTHEARSVRPAPAGSSRRHARLLGALRNLSFEPRAALLLREGAGLSREEVAHVLDLSPAQTADLLVGARVAAAQAGATPDRTGRLARIRRLAGGLLRR